MTASSPSACAANWRCRETALPVTSADYLLPQRLAGLRNRYPALTDASIVFGALPAFSRPSRPF